MISSVSGTLMPNVTPIINAHCETTFLRNLRCSLVHGRYSIELPRVG